MAYPESNNIIQFKNTSGSSLEVGDVVRIDPTRADGDGVSYPSVAGEGEIAGIVYKNAAFTRSVDLQSSGVAIVKVDSSGGPIEIGDLLVSKGSNTGLAAKGSGGFILGKALEAFSSHNQGLIKVKLHSIPSVEPNDPIASWGRIFGNLKEQSDLSEALSNKQPLNSILTNLSVLGGSGLTVRKPDGLFVSRSITAGSDITITNGDGVSGNPTVSLGNNIPRLNKDNAFSGKIAAASFDGSLSAQHLVDIVSVEHGGTGISSLGAGGQVLATKADLSGTEWITVTATGGGVSGVSSVNGKVGDVILSASDVGATTTSYVTSSINTKSTYLEGLISGKANLSHAHDISGITGLQDALNLKAQATHVHSASDLTTGTIPNGRFPSVLPALSGANLTNISAATISGTITVEQGGTGLSSVGAPLQVLATKSDQSGVEWISVSGVGGDVASVNGQTGTVVLTATDVGAAPTTHTHSESDITGLASSLSLKASVSYVDTSLSSKANASHAHAQSDIIGLSSSLAAKAALSHTHATSEVTGLDTALSGKASTTYVDSGLATKASTSHTHATSEVTGLDTALSGKASSSHTHATSDVTGLSDALAAKASTTDLTTGLATKASTSHTHATADVTGLDTALSGKASTSHAHATSDVTGLDTALSGKASTSHTHATSDVTGLSDALAAKASTTDLTAGLATKASTSHTHATSDVTGLDTALAGKAPTSHAHATSQITGLDTALSGKASTSHTHATSEVTGLDTALSGKASTSHTHATSDVTGLSDALAAKASTTDLTAGLATKASTSHTHATSDVTGLDTALSGKASTTYVDSGLATKASSSHTHATSEVTGLDDALAAKASTTDLTAGLATKASTSHTHATSEVTGLDTALSGKASTSHTHATSEVTGLDTTLAAKASTTDLTTGLATKASTSHTHATSDVTGLDTALSGKASTSHTHATSEVTGLDTALSGKAPTSHTHSPDDLSAAVPHTKGGTGLTALGSGLQVLRTNAGGTAIEWGTASGDGGGAPILADNGLERIEDTIQISEAYREVFDVNTSEGSVHILGPQVVKSTQAPAAPAADNATYYVTTSGTSPNKTVTGLYKLENGVEIIVFTAII